MSANAECIDSVLLFIQWYDCLLIYVIAHNDRQGGEPVEVELLCNLRENVVGDYGLVGKITTVDAYAYGSVAQLVKG